MMSAFSGWLKDKGLYNRGEFLAALRTETYVHAALSQPDFDLPPYKS